ncbi:Protein kinase domain [Dillenia turbinata]|uniref:Protein kinase domain n=1 Tax=Dillenia turbinata TaxID=194707 RepID=A0AAN8VGE3_9MAGN
MKCFHFTNGERRDDNEDSVVSRVSKVSWARSLSVASTSIDVRRSEFDSESRDFGDSIGFYEFLSQRRRANNLRVFSFAELKSATRGFSRALMIGEGGFQGHKEWINEVNFLGVVNHPNLVKLVGYCAEDDERGIQRLLVYELMRNKSLEDHLLARTPSPLPWITRLKIAQDAARGLAYLHEDMDFQLIFRDFKTSNILLDEDFNAKLSDFGLARQGPSAGLGHVSTSASHICIPCTYASDCLKVVGTVGYAAPEYVQTGRLTAKSDVWSFGVVLYELITGRRALERNLPRSEQKLLEWVRPYISDPKKFHHIIDPRLEGEYCIKSAQKLASLANKCLMKHPKSRPKMSEVVEMLGNIINEASFSQDELNSQSVKETDDVNEEPVPVGSSEIECMQPENTEQKKVVLNFREMVLRNKSVGKLDWRNWTPGLVRTW